MPLQRDIARADQVRVPSVPRGTVVIVSRYREDKVKAAVLNAEDLEMLEESHELLEQLGQLDPLPLSDLELRALETEERPSPQQAIEDPAKIKALLGL